VKTDGGPRDLLVAEVARLLLVRAVGHPLRVAVDGITCAGKSTFADELAAAVTGLGRPVARVSMDGFHHRREHRYRQGRQSGDGYYEDAYDFRRAARELLAPLGPGGSLRYRDRILDLVTDRPVDSWATATPDTVLIVDGSFLQRAELVPYWDEVIYLHVDLAVAFDRGVSRDADAMGGREAAAQAYAQRYHAAGRRYLREVDPLARAGIVLDNNDLGRPQRVGVSRRAHM
jgi:uridine kinase